MDKEVIMKEILSKLQGQEDSDFDYSTHLQRLFERAVMKSSGRQLDQGDRD